MTFESSKKDCITVRVVGMPGLVYVSGSLRDESLKEMYFIIYVCLHFADFKSKSQITDHICVAI